ncbi:putative permease [Beggiatoa alba B18LD]|uniref:Probable membrane transporter protein n=1 Tax=Beggiatoa alba B18LD TaxID=395493 RepID=I3CHI0_9GAMM|nr:sulfite exporter TauE/SafE family protein [Beggiatoa alba]EIJ43073.1 putative permease [Beggiatoa alba B18LD]
MSEKQDVIDFSARTHTILAFMYAVPISTLGGLIGLGGAEFRLPVLVGVLRYNISQAISINLFISLVTLLIAFFARKSVLSLEPLLHFIPAMLALTSGGVFAAFFGGRLVTSLSKEQLERLIMWLLSFIGLLLIIEGFMPESSVVLLPNSWLWHVVAGILLGIGIGLASSLLGIAGGELIIPTLILGYGMDIKWAGTASLLISLPIVMTGVIRHLKHGAYQSSKVFTNTLVPMSIGSVIGAMIGGILVGVIAPTLLKILLGIILIISAIKIFLH